MEDASIEELKEQLQAMGGRSMGIDLDTPFHRVVDGLMRPVPFFQQLPELLPPDSILYVEGTGIAPDVADFYVSHRAPNATEVVRDTIAPVPDIYHFTFSPEVLAGLRQFAESRPMKEMFDHLKAYRGETLLFTFHDAFQGSLLISERIPEQTIDQFCQALGASSQREETTPRDPELFRKILAFLENPQAWRVSVEPWWKRLWKRWIRR